MISSRVLAAPIARIQPVLNFFGDGWYSLIVIASVVVNLWAWIGHRDAAGKRGAAAWRWAWA